MALCFEVDVMKQERSVRAAGKRERVLAKILLNVMGSVVLPFRSKGWWLLTSCACSSVEASAVLVGTVGITCGK